jgi:hypothetical protein
MSRARVELNPEQVSKLARLGCSMREIADVLGCDEKTIRNNFRSDVEKGQTEMRNRLRRYMWRAAKAGAPAPLIFMAKNLLGWVDKPAEVTEEKKAPPVLQIVRPPQSQAGT